jgi:glycosyltransferase involved in cell wall biosynthesis
MSTLKMRSEPSPLVSVVMCAYNTRPYIEQAVASVLDQQYQNLELIISDDGSTDGTREWLQTLTDPRIRLFLQEQNLGYVANKNFALQQATGDFITQNDSDDFSDTNRIGLQVAAVASHPEIRMIGCGYHKVDDAGVVYDTQGVGENRLLTGQQHDFPFWFPSLLIHRDLYRQFGYYTPLFEGMGDDHYWTVVANEQYPVYHIGQPLYHYRNNPNSITNVLSNDRKLIVAPLVEELFRQRKDTGTDWLQQGQLDAIRTYEAKLLGDQLFMSERYRLWAALYLDKGNTSKAGSLLRKAFKKAPLSPQNFRTLFYYLKTRLGSGQH